MPRYVILEHHWDGVHWDLLLEAGSAMLTWSLSCEPDAPGPITAVPKPDHGLAFLDYEGPISRGRGRVARWDRGEFAWLERADARIRVRLTGGRLEGASTLEAGRDNWTYRFEPAQ